MINYSELSKNARNFLAMTGDTVEEFQALLPHFVRSLRSRWRHRR